MQQPPDAPSSPCPLPKRIRAAMRTIEMLRGVESGCWINETTAAIEPRELNALESAIRTNSLRILNAYILGEESGEEPADPIQLPQNSVVVPEKFWRELIGALQVARGGSPTIVPPMFTATPEDPNA